MGCAFFDLGVTDAPLQEFKSVATHFAPKRIDVEKTNQTLRTDPADSVDVFAGAFRTNCMPH